MEKEPIVDTPHAIVLLANNATIGSGRKVAFQSVQSRMLLWCRSGSGAATVNGKEFALVPGAFLILPWNHAIRYRQERELHIAGVHIVPELAPGSAVQYGIVHRPVSNRVIDPRPRRNVALPLLESVIAGRFDETPALRHLAEYTILAANPRDFTEPVARQLGQMMLAEWQRVAQMLTGDQSDLPPAMRMLITRLDQRLAQPRTLDAMAQLAGCSRTTLNRLFHAHMGSSPIAWLNRRRLERAAELLASSSLPVSEVGKEVGITDPYYFSRLFRQYAGVTCTVYRRQNALLWAHGSLR